MPNRPTPGAENASTRCSKPDATGAAAGRRGLAIELLRRARQFGNRTDRATCQPARGDPTQRSHRPGGLAPGEVPRQGAGPALAAATVALLAIGAWWLLSNG